MSNVAQHVFLPLSSICDNQVSFSSDESPCCTISTRSWFSQTRVIFICTDFPGFQQVGTVPLTINVHPFSCQTPEYCHSEEQPLISRHNQLRNRWRQWPGSNRRSSMRFAFREGIGLLSEPFVPPDWPFSWRRISPSSSSLQQESSENPYACSLFFQFQSKCFRELEYSSERVKRKRRWNWLWFRLRCRFVCSCSRISYNSRLLSYRLPCACCIILIVTKSSCFLCQISHEFVKLVLNPDPRLRSVSRQRINSNLNSWLSLVVIGHHFQYRTNFCISTNPSFWCWWFVISKWCVLSTCHVTIKF